MKRLLVLSAIGVSIFTQTAVAADAVCEKLRVECQDYCQAAVDIAKCAEACPQAFQECAQCTQQEIKCHNDCLKLAALEEREFCSNDCGRRTTLCRLNHIRDFEPLIPRQE